MFFTPSWSTERVPFFIPSRVMALGRRRKRGECGGPRIETTRTQALLCPMLLLVAERLRQPRKTRKDEGWIINRSRPILVDVP